MDLAAARDIAIIFLAILNIIVLIILAILLYVLVRLVRDQLVPLLGSVRRTVNTVEGTTDYISRTAVTPIVRIAGLAVAASRFLEVIRGRSGKKKRGKARIEL